MPRDAGAASTRRHEPAKPLTEPGMASARPLTAPHGLAVRGTGGETRENSFALSRYFFFAAFAGFFAAGFLAVLAVFLAAAFMVVPLSLFPRIIRGLCLITCSSS